MKVLEWVYGDRVYHLSQNDYITAPYIFGQLILGPTCEATNLLQAPKPRKIKIRESRSKVGFLEIKSRKSR